MRPIGWVTRYGHIAPYTRPHGTRQCGPAVSFDVAPTDLDLPDQLVDACLRRELALFGEMGITEGGEDGLVTEDFLHFQQVDARFNQMRGIAVAQAVGREFFLTPQASVTRRNVVCTPPRSSGVVAC